MVPGLMVIGPDWPGQGLFGSFRFGSGKFGLGWLALSWSVSVRSGPAQPGPTQPSPARYSPVWAAFGRPAGIRIGDLGVLGMVSVPGA